jgi:hypothetical protein
VEGEQQAHTGKRGKTWFDEREVVFALIVYHSVALLFDELIVYRLAL